MPNAVENGFTSNLHLKSTLQELPLYDFQVECSHPGQEITRISQVNALLPGIHTLTTQLLSQVNPHLEHFDSSNA